MQRGLGAISGNSLAGNCLSLGETEAHARGRNLLFSSFQCVFSISWAAKLRNGKKVQEFLALPSQVAGLICG